jgi:glycerol-3-phosphate acyltransferase PlsX
MNNAVGGRIALDAMGGDNAPVATIAGVVAARRNHGVEVTLVGDLERLSAELERNGESVGDYQIVHAGEVVGMDEQPAAAIRQKLDSSIRVAAQLVQVGEAQALISMGNSGATMAAAVLVVGRAPGVSRPALAGVLPGTGGRTLLLDIGANSECTPDNLLQFAIMGSLYMEAAHGVGSPRVGLLNVGEEDVKGNQLVLEAHELLQASELNFRGNVEGVDLFRAVVDVAVCDGFTGNVAIKVMEGTGDFAFGMLRAAGETSARSKLGALLMRPALRTMRTSFDYAEWGGAPLLGVNGLVFIGHGRSHRGAVERAIVEVNAALSGNLPALLEKGLARA